MVKEVFSDKFVKESSIMHHRLSKIFRTYLFVILPKRYSMSRPVVFDRDRMINGYIRGALLEISHRIASRRHYVANQSIALRDGLSGGVDKTRLRGTP